MDNLKNDRYYVSKANENIKVIQRYIGHKTYEEFISDEELIDAIMFRLVQLIENIKNRQDHKREKVIYLPDYRIKKRIIREVPLDKIQHLLKCRNPECKVYPHRNYR